MIIFSFDYFEGNWKGFSEFKREEYVNYSYRIMDI